MLLILIQLILFFLFAFLIANLVKREKLLDLFIVFLAIATVTIGEAMNLFVYKMAVYNGVYGIPIYIILGGAMISWGVFNIALKISKKLHIECIFVRVFILFVLSVFLPVIEVIGLKTELWYWQRPYSIVSLSWFLGVWKFYFIFIVLPAVIGLFLDVFRGDNHNCCKLA
jgi:hypothetical protein